MKHQFKEAAYLLDMDGTLYLDNQPLAGALEFIRELNQQNIPYCLLTNNSSRSRQDYVSKLEKLGFEVGLEKILSSGLAAARYLKAKGFQKVFLLGTPSLEKEFEEHGIVLGEEEAEAVVLGFDMTLTYEKLKIAHCLLKDDLPYFATHPDFVCPTVEGDIPDTGAMIAFLEASCGRVPQIIGKPHQPIVEMACEILDVPSSRIIMVGDRLYTDIAMGVDSPIRTLLVFSGETRPGDLECSEIQPDYQFRGIFEVYDLIRE